MSLRRILLAAAGENVLLGGQAVIEGVKLAVRLAAVPLIAGISYEAIRLWARRREDPLCAALIRPGLWLQRLTTREPDDEQIAVALSALREALGGDPRARGEFVPL